MRILVMGLPGSGKTTLAQNLLEDLARVGLKAKWYNADDVRSAEEDWDFSDAGRVRQAERMRSLADDSAAYGFPYVICDFVCPTQKLRNIFDPDLVVWMDTIEVSRYADTNKVWEPPIKYDYRIRELNKFPWSEIIVDGIKKNNEA